MTDDIKLPPLPEASKMYDIPGYDEEELKDYARAAVLADRAGAGHPMNNNTSEETMPIFDQIRQWATDRNLIEGATRQAQMLKLFEEGGELAGAIARGKEDVVKDSIGDMVVVLTIVAAQSGLTIEECIAAAYDEIKDRKGRMVDGVFVKQESADG
jgi:NTP pyrophosphatase (non-canonical NTP hydrolase)